MANHLSELEGKLKELKLDTADAGEQLDDLALDSAGDIAGRRSRSEPVTPSHPLVEQKLRTGSGDEIKLTWKEDSKREVEDKNSKEASKEDEQANLVSSAAKDEKPVAGSPAEPPQDKPISAKLALIARKNTKVADLAAKLGYRFNLFPRCREFGPPLNWPDVQLPPHTVLMIKRIPDHLYEDTLVPLFSRGGKLYSFKLATTISGLNAGYAFATYFTKVEARRQLKDVRQYSYVYGHMQVDWQDHRRALFVARIPRTASRLQVQIAAFNKFKGLTQVLVYMNKKSKNENRGFCFMRFETHDMARFAKTNMSKFRFMGCTVTAEWANDKRSMEEQNEPNVNPNLWVGCPIIAPAIEAKKDVEPAINAEADKKAEPTMDAKGA